MNRFLSIAKGSIPYIKELRPYAGSLSACVAMQQLDYWFDKMPDGFYKFVDTCEHRLYKPGQSWCEELGMSRDEWRSAWAHIGVTYTSKKKLEKAENSFINADGKEVFYCVVQDRISKVSYYYRNHKLLDKVFDEILRGPTPAAVGENPSTDWENSQQGAGKIPAAVGENPSTDVQKPQSYTEDYSEDYQKNTSEDYSEEEFKTPYIPQGELSAEEKFFSDSVEVSKPESPLPKQPALKDLPKSSGSTDAPGAFAPLPKHDPEGFREFWAQHPRKVGRQNAVRAWDKIKPNPETKGQIMHSLGWNKANNPQWTKDGGQFIPHPATWLNGLRWTDEQTIIAPEQQSRPMTTTEKNIKFLREYRQKHGLEA